MRDFFGFMFQVPCFMLRVPVFDFACCARFGFWGLNCYFRQVKYCNGKAEAKE